MVAIALNRGHDVTLFNRGQADPGLFPDAEELVGDRDGELGVLAGRRWDAVVDTCGYVPRVVRESATLLSNSVDRYVFVSTLSVYHDFTAPGVNEDSPLAALDDETVEEITADTYGGLKVLCERAVQDEIPGRTLITRPGLIVGPYDPSDRFTYWPARIERGGEVLAPGRPERQVQFIDARDLARWTLYLIKKGATGVFNATGPAEAITMKELLATCRLVAGHGGECTWVTEEFLTDEGVAPYSDMPLWIPCEDDTVDCSRAQSSGLTYRPLSDTVRDTLEWHRSRGSDYTLRAGLSTDRESDLLQRWSERRVDPQLTP
jgi:2'-hydroxyisoflavone reductase